MKTPTYNPIGKYYFSDEKSEKRICKRLKNIGIDQVDVADFMKSIFVIGHAPLTKELAYVLLKRGLKLQFIRNFDVDKNMSNKMIAIHITLPVWCVIELED